MPPATAALIALALNAIPFRPSDDAMPLGNVSSEAPQALQELRALDDRNDAIAYARRMLDRAETTQDPAYAHYAFAALKPHRANGDAELRVVYATVLQRLHRFDDALAELDALLKTPNAPAQAFFVRSVLRTLRADYTGALRDCAALLGRVEPLAVAACAALPRARSGHSDAAYSALVDMLDTAPGIGPVGDFARGVAGELAWRLGKPDALHRLADAAETGKPVQVLNHADALLAIGKPNEALQVLQKLPGDGADLRRARAQQALGDAHADLRRSIESGIEARALRNDTGHAREDAYYFAYIAHDGPRALRAAQINFAQQKEPIDAELLVDAARLAGDEAALGPVRQWLETNAIVDVPLQRRLAR